ncbi:hypothetical protein E2C01_086032 [Portunus trituberculatus]|uniref:Uncharacterized protein n=1 Tax=Portunus trituberculatus TaxID=210409 RepID=A0A5B7J4D9_PORTR|nr:hypothetical protein [Portunus trituberculatus]
MAMMKGAPLAKSQKIFLFELVSEKPVQRDMAFYSTDDVQSFRYHSNQAKSMKTPNFKLGKE